MSATLGAGLPSTALPVPKGWAQASFNLCIVLPILAGFAVAGRFYLRRLQRFRPGVDDWLVLAALVIYWVQAIVAGLAVPYGGIGYHIKDLEPQRVQYLLKLTFVLRNFYALPLALTKASICFFLLRFFAVKRWFRIGAYSIVAWSISFVLLNILGSLLACAPIAANWEDIPGAHCTNVEGIVIAVAVVDVLINLAIVVMPMPIICTLQMSARDKFLLIALLSFGTFDTLAGALRVVTSIELHLETDYTFGMRKLWFWSELEPGMAICVACLVVMRPLLDKAIRNRRSFHSKTTTSGPASPELGWVDAEKLQNGSTVTTVKATGDAFDVELAKLDQEYGFYQTGSGEVRPHNFRPGGAIVVSREVFVAGEDRLDKPTSVV